MVNLDYNQFLSSLKEIDDPASIQWDGSLYLPPCQCASTPSYGCSTTASNNSTSPLLCQQVSSSPPAAFDYKSFDDLDTSTLTNLSSFTTDVPSRRSTVTYWLCNKYSPSASASKITDYEAQISLASTAPKDFIRSEAFQTCLDVLRTDLYILTPFNHCSTTLQLKDSTNKKFIKYILQCSQSHVFRPWEERTKYKAPIKGRKTETTKPIKNEHKCKFYINLFFDLKLLRWFMKGKNNIMHSFHHPTQLDEFKLQQKHLTKTMHKELEKLNNANTCDYPTIHFIFIVKEPSCIHTKPSHCSINMYHCHIIVQGNSLHLKVVQSL